MRSLSPEASLQICQTLAENQLSFSFLAPYFSGATPPLTGSYANHLSPEQRVVITILESQTSLPSSLFKQYSTPLHHSNSYLQAMSKNPSLPSSILRQIYVLWSQTYPSNPQLDRLAYLAFRNCRTVSEKTLASWFAETQRSALPLRNTTILGDWLAIRHPLGDTLFKPLLAYATSSAAGAHVVSSSLLYNQSLSPSNQIALLSSLNWLQGRKHEQERCIYAHVPLPPEVLYQVYLSPGTILKRSLTSQLTRLSFSQLTSLYQDRHTRRLFSKPILSALTTTAEYRAFLLARSLKFLSLSPVPTTAHLALARQLARSTIKEL